MEVNASRLEDRLDPLEQPYRSRAEAQVGRLLDRYGIPFFYQQPLLVLDRGRYHRWHPDLTLPTYDGLILEYAGMPDVPDYMDGIRHQRQVYAANGMPALCLYPSDLRGPGWPESIAHRIHAVASQQRKFPCG